MAELNIVPLDEAIEEALERRRNDISGIAAEAAVIAVERVLERRQPQMLDEFANATEKDKFELKRKGNKEQYKHHLELKGLVEKAEIALENNRLQDAKEALTEGKKSILKRMKCIKLADREGWNVVEEYLSDDLADDSDDEKAIEKAIKSANAKATRNRQKSKFRRGAYSNKQSSDRNRDYHSYRQGSRYGPEHNYNRGSKRRQKLCFICQKPGHFMDNCPNAVPYSRSYQRR